VVVVVHLMEVRLFLVVMEVLGVVVILGLLQALAEVLVILLLFHHHKAIMVELEEVQMLLVVEVEQLLLEETQVVVLLVLAVMELRQQLADHQ
jgi:hypothetical protein